MKHSLSTILSCSNSMCCLSVHLHISSGSCKHQYVREWPPRELPTGLASARNSIIRIMLALKHVVVGLCRVLVIDLHDKV